jgi:hypothetical protein
MYQLNDQTIATSTNGQGAEWTDKTPVESYRVCVMRQRLYRRDKHPAYFGGYQIRYVALNSERGRKVAHEWLYGTVGQLPVLA